MAGVTVRQRAGAVSVTGRREMNEDAYFLTNGPFGHGKSMAALAVADGMGGHDSGHVASRLAIETAVGVLSQRPAETDALREAILEAHSQIRDRALESATGLSMGTTMTFVLVRSDVALVGHVGDSRAYLFSRGQLSQITDDQSRVGRLVRSGVISEEEALGHPDGNVLEQCLGAGADPEVETYRVGIGSNDVLLLSTDGLHGVVGRSEIQSVLTAEASTQRACQRLVDLALERGSSDNITVVAWQYPGPATRTLTNPGTIAGRVMPGPAPVADNRSPSKISRARLAVLAGAGVGGFVLGLLGQGLTR